MKCKLAEIICNNMFNIELIIQSVSLESIPKKTVN